MEEFIPDFEVEDFQEVDDLLYGQELYQTYDNHSSDETNEDNVHNKSQTEDQNQRYKSREQTDEEDNRNESIKSDSNSEITLKSKTSSQRSDDCNKKHKKHLKSKHSSKTIEKPSEEQKSSKNNQLKDSNHKTDVRPEVTQKTKSKKKSKKKSKETSDTERRNRRKGSPKPLKDKTKSSHRKRKNVNNSVETTIEHRIVETIDISDEDSDRYDPDLVCDPCLLVLFKYPSVDDFIEKALAGTADLSAFMSEQSDEDSDQTQEMSVGVSLNQRNPMEESDLSEPELLSIYTKCDQPMGQIKSVATNINPIESVATNVNPIKSVATNVNPIESVATNVNPIESVATNVNPIESVATNVNPIESVATNVNPIESVTKNVKPIKSVTKNVKPIKSVTKNVKPIKSETKNETPIKIVTENVDPTKSGPKLKSMDPNSELKRRWGHSSKRLLAVVSDGSESSDEILENNPKNSNELTVGSIAKIYKCDSCSYNTNSKQFLILHSGLHKTQTKQKTETQRKSSVKSNQKKKKSKNKDKECTYFDSYRNQEALTQRAIDELIKNLPEHKEFRCDSCDFVTNQELELIIHSTQHSSGLPVEGLIDCQICGQLLEISDLDQHKRESHSFGSVFTVENIQIGNQTNSNEIVTAIQAMETDFQFNLNRNQMDPLMTALDLSFNVAEDMTETDIPNNSIPEQNQTEVHTISEDTDYLYF